MIVRADPTRRGATSEEAESQITTIRTTHDIVSGATEVGDVVVSGGVLNVDSGGSGKTTRNPEGRHHDHR